MSVHAGVRRHIYSYLGSIALAASASAQTYSIAEVPVLPGGTFGSATAISNNGKIAGYSETATGDIHAFLHASGATVDLGTLRNGHAYSLAYDVNDGGVVVGESQDADGNSYAFRYANGQMKKIGLPGIKGGSAWGINAAGDIAGDAQAIETDGSLDIAAFLLAGNHKVDLGGLPGSTFSSAAAVNSLRQAVGISDEAANPDITRPVLWAAGATLDLGGLGGDYGGATDINDAGQIAGYSRLASGDTHAFLYVNGAMLDLGVLGSVPGGFSESAALAINSAGRVVGNSTNPAGGYSGFLYANGVMVDLNTLLPPGSGWTIIEASDINDAGQIVGHGYKDGVSGIRPFVMTPVVP